VSHDHELWLSASKAEADRSKKNWTKSAKALGPAILVSTYAWEFARTNPDYTFLIQPWAMRGDEMVHGVVMGLFSAAVVLTIKPIDMAANRLISR
jgi:hypothetical protein